MPRKIPVVLYYLNGRQIMRSRPAKVRQTKNTLKAGTAFGKTSSLAAALLQCFEPVIPFKEKREPYNTFFKALMNWTVAQKSNPQQPQKDSDLLTGVRFVKEAGVEARFKAPYTIDYIGSNEVKVHIPAFVPTDSISAPQGCSNIELKMMAVSCKPNTGEILAQGLEKVNIAYNTSTHAAIDKTFTITMPANSLTLVAFALKYDCITWSSATKKSDRRWMPAGIVGSWWK